MVLAAELRDCTSRGWKGPGVRSRAPKVPTQPWPWLFFSSVCRPWSLHGQESAPSAPEPLCLGAFGFVVALETHNFLGRAVWEPPPHFPLALPNLASPHTLLVSGLLFFPLFYLLKSLLITSVLSSQHPKVICGGFQLRAEAL